MKFLLYIAYFFRSAYLRGLINTIRFLLAEVKHEHVFGIKTSMIKKNDSPEFFHYQGAGYQVLMRLFKTQDARTKNFNFVDIGSGKGRAVFVAEYCGYSNLTGIEMDAELFEEARQNAARYAFKRKESFVKFIHANALDYSFTDSPTVYFLFNPFNAEILTRVLEKIKASTRSETWFIYMNPLYRKVFDEQGYQLIQELKTRRYLEALVYKWPGQLLH